MRAVMLSSDEPDDALPAQYRFSRPDNEAPAAVGVSGVVGRSADTAVLLAGLVRYTDGLQIDLAVRHRLDPEPDDHLHAWYSRGLFVGVELPDGRTVVAGQHDGGAWPADEEPVLTHQSGGGSGREWSSTLWLTPAPPPGDLVLVVQWPSRDIAESTLTVDAESLRAAADRTEVLWPREPDPAPQHVQPPPVDVPAGGWFERASAAARTDEP